MTRDRCTGLIALLLGVAAAVATTQIPPSTIANDIGPRVFPYISAAILIACGGSLVVVGGANKQERYFTPTELKRLAAILLLVLFYAIAMVWIGYVIPTLIVTLLLCAMFAQGEQVRLWKLVVFSVVLTVLIYFIFTNILVMKLPSGKLF